jgi:hypothetical protein
MKEKFKMKFHKYYAQMYYGTSKFFTSAIVEGFKQLLENKHLYQNQEVIFPEFDVFIDNCSDYLTGKIAIPPIDMFSNCYKLIQETEWTIENPYPTSAGVITSNDESMEVDISIGFIPPTIKSYCPTCENKEAYNFVYGDDLLNISMDLSWLGEPKGVQIFAIQYQCQACKSIPEVFIVRRKDWKISLNGRSPMEVVKVPDFIPKNQRKFYSDAIIAFNSGQILAGNFLLRTFIEQFIRGNSSNPNSEKIEPIFDEYMATLPDDFKTRFPSLTEIYGKLSEDIHTATGSVDIFIWSKDRIEKHFDARRLYELVGK